MAQCVLLPDLKPEALRIYAFFPFINLPQYRFTAEQAYGLFTQPVSYTTLLVLYMIPTMKVCIFVFKDSKG